MNQMSAIWNKLKKSAEDKEGEKSSKDGFARKSDDDKKKKPKKAKSDIEKALLFEKVIIRPLVSENAMNQQMLGKYVFEVSQAAPKPEIAKAVKALYGVDVLKVNIAKYDRRMKRFRNTFGMTGGYKKAIVTIDKQQSIELFTEAK